MYKYTHPLSNVSNNKIFVAGACKFWRNFVSIDYTVRLCWKNSFKDPSLHWHKKCLSNRKSVKSAPTLDKHHRNKRFVRFAIWLKVIGLTNQCLLLSIPWWNKIGLSAKKTRRTYPKCDSSSTLSRTQLLWSEKNWNKFTGKHSNTRPIAQICPHVITTRLGYSKKHWKEHRFDDKVWKCLCAID